MLESAPVLKNTIFPQMPFLHVPSKVPPKKISFCKLIISLQQIKYAGYASTATQKLAIGLFNNNKEEEKVSLEYIDDLYNYAEKLKAAVMSHLPQTDAPSA